MNKKTVAIFAVCMVLVAALSVFTTLALLQDSKTLTNTFTSGNVSITLDELVHGTTTNQRTDDPQTYSLLPGTAYTKDPTIHVTANSEDCYIAATVEFTNGVALMEGDAATDDDDLSYAEMLAIYDITIADGWVENNTISSGNSYKVTYIKEAPVSKAASVQDFQIFTTETFSADATNAQLAYVNNSQIIVTAYAVQQSSFTSAAQALSEAFNTSETIFTYTPDGN